VKAPGTVGDTIQAFINTLLDFSPLSQFSAARGGFCAIVTEANPNNDKDSANVNTRCFKDDLPAVISN